MGVLISYGVGPRAASVAFGTRQRRKPKPLMVLGVVAINGESAPSSESMSNVGTSRVVSD
jgi:hypothetical protein